MILVNNSQKPCIYVITNLINGKQYVGQTVRFKERMWEHENDPRSQSVLHQAIQKYGADNFTADILEEVDDKNLLDELEIKWIVKLNTFHFGYNMTKGGDGRGHKESSKRVIQYSYDYKTIINTYDSINEAGYAMGGKGKYVTIRRCCMNDNGHGGQVLHAYNYGWVFENTPQDEIEYRQKETDKTAFYAYELNADKTKKDLEPQLYYIQADAAEKLQVNAGCIKQILRGTNKTTRSKDGKIYTFAWKNV